ncbi:MAG: hypothetical protein KC777_24305 [Cyanobacteria bacterium HKST-UBA02]|nr:hypothetical protein [Cyanobacteria bacterium HKST-UBA02]
MMEFTFSINTAVTLLLSILANGFLIAYLFPKLNGFTFTGKFWPEGILYALGLELTALVVNLLVMVAVIVTLGLAIIPLAFFMIFGFWLINAIYLKILAHWFPQHLRIDGWVPAIIAGLILMVVGMLLGDHSVATIHYDVH